MNIINFLNLKSKNKMSKLEDDLTSNNNANITTNNIKSKSNECKSINTNSALIYNENKWTKLLTKYFETINTIDNSLEQIRSKLNAQNNFSSLNLFNYLDKNSKQFLTLNDFMTYLKENNIIFSEKNLRKLIHNFDKDNDFSLNYKEFLGIITPKKKDLKNIDTLPQDKVDSIPENNSISNEIKKIFGELISEELNLVEKCHELSQNIRNSKEFTTYEAFKEIVGEEKYINAENLKIYLNNKNINITDVEINQLMFRIDSDNDGMISYEEFKNIFLPLNDIEYNQNENGKEKDIKNNTILNNINENNYNNNERNNYIIDLPLKLSNNNKNKNFYNNINNNENKENNKNEINIKQKFNFDINLNNKEKAMDYKNNDENEDCLNISHSLYEEKNKNNKIEILDEQNIIKEKENTINTNIANINGDNLLELNNPSIIKNEGDYYINENNNLIYQTQSILGFMNQKNNKSNNYNRNDNKNEAKKNYHSLRASYKKEKKQKDNINAKNGGNLIDTLLNFDYSKNSNEDIAKNLYCLEYKEKDISSEDFNRKSLKGNGNNYPYDSKINKNDKNSFNSLYNNNYKLDNNKNNDEKENIISTYILNSKNYKKGIKGKNINPNKSEFFIDEEIDSKQINDKSNIRNDKSNYSSYMNNYNKYKLNNDNNNYYKKIKLNQNKLNVNNSFSTYYIRHNPKNNQNLSENLYIDSLENSITINQNYYNQKLERNMQDNTSYSINNSNKLNHSMIDLNNKTKKNLKENSFKRIYIDKGNDNNLNKSCFMLPLDDQNNFDDIDNEYNNENIDYNNCSKMNMKFCRNCIEKRCPKCNCIQAKIRFIDKDDNEMKFENNNLNNTNNKNSINNTNNKKNINNINNTNKNKIKSSKCSSLPKYKFKKSNTLTAKINTSNSKFRYYLDSSQNNNNFKINSLNATNNNSNNKISKNTYKKQIELNFNKKCNSLYNLMMNYLKQDTSIEEIRQLLSTKEDANLTDLFEIFDHSSKECIGSMDFLQTLKQFGLILNMDDIKFFYKKFNKNINEFFDYEEFCEIILPKKYSNAKIMGEKSNEDFFDLSEETKNIICLLFQNIIEGEKSNENYRKIIGIEEECNGFDLFNKIKKNYSIGIYKEDLANFMKKNKNRLNNRDIELLMERFDKNKDGMIDFKEFLSEITPLD